MRRERGDRCDIEEHAGPRLSRNGEDQIQIEPIEAGAMRHRCCRAGLVGGMKAAEKFERRGIERLRAETDSIHARRAHPDEVREVHGAGIRLERYFRIVFDSANAIGSVYYFTDGFWIEQRSRAASKKNRPHTLARIRRRPRP